MVKELWVLSILIAFLLTPLTGLRAEAASEDMVQFRANRPSLSGTVYTIDSPSGRFKIHWTDSGSDSTTLDYANSVALAGDSSWAVQCDQLGFYHPPPDNEEGGDDKYDIYLLGFSGGVTGYMSHSGEYMPPDSTHSCSASHMCISTGIENPDERNCIAANLFAQAVGAAYDYAEPSGFVAGYSAWMEKIVFPDADSYLEYLQQENPLENPWKEMGTFGSSDFPWVAMAVEVWGIQSIRNIWEYCAEQTGANAWQALEDMLQDNGMTVEEFFMDYGAWRWFTAGNWFEGCGMYGPYAAQWEPGPAVLSSHEISVLPHQGTQEAGSEPEELGLNWIRLDLASYQGEWIEFDFDGNDGCQWSLGTILQDVSGNLYFQWYECDPETGEKTVAVNSEGWDYAVFFPACIESASSEGTYSFEISSQGTGFQEPPYGGEELNLKILSNPAGNVHISFLMPAGGPARAVLFDLAGRQSRLLMNDKLTAGAQTLRYDCSGLQAGTYFLMVFACDRVEGTKLVIVR